MRILIGIIALIIASCSGQIERLPKPDNLIPKEKMIDVLTDLTKLEGLVQNKYGQVSRYYRVMTASGDSLLKVHYVNRKQFEESMDYYGSRQEEMAAMYDEVLERLNKELAKEQ